MNRQVLVVDDDRAVRRLLGRLLEQAGFEVFSAGGGQEALHVLRQDGPPIVITDWDMPEMDGLELCKAIRQSEELGFVYIIIVTGHTDKVVEAFEAGADDFMAKPPRHGELLARLKAASRIVQLEADLARQNRALHQVNAQLVALNSALEQTAVTDELTGLLNRRAAIDRLEEYCAISDRYAQALSVVWLDIDHFKQVNDTHGHAVGDLVLRETAKVLARCVRTSDMLARFGGEEFLILCPATDATETTIGAERLRRRVEANEIGYEGQTLGVTVSIGVADRYPHILTPDELLRQADNALYAAKAQGRNRVCVAGVEVPRVDSGEAEATCAAEDESSI